MTIIEKAKSVYKKSNISAWIFFLLLVYVVLVIKLITFKDFNNNWLFAIYSVGVSLYILSRFALAHFYAPEHANIDSGYTPTIAFGVPSYNEAENIRKTIMKIAESDYPKDKLEIVAVNDGSTDDTYAEMMKAKKDAASLGVNVKVVNWEKNQGKREGMVECVLKTKSEIMIFIDSDSFVDSNAAKMLVNYFKDAPKVAAVAGHAFVYNGDENFITKMQAVRYYVAFKAYKAAEALFGSVTCCSGCCSAYRREALLEILNEFKNQKFLGVRCTYGDDRSLTNLLLKQGYNALYAADAISYTIVPDTLRKFMKQQLRWKKSWVRESLIASTFMWRRNPVMSISFYLGLILPLIAPVIVVRALLWYPLTNDIFPWFYLLGLTLMALLYGFYYRIHVKDRKWVYGVIFASFYTVVLIWQLPWAIINIRDSSWGTR